MSLEGDRNDQRLDHLALALGADSPQFSINISHSPESSPEPPTPTSLQYGTDLYLL